LVREGDDRVGTPEEFFAAVKGRTGTAAVVCVDGEFVAKTMPVGEREALRVEEVPAVLAPVIGRIALERARQGETQNALTLDANYVRRSDAELFWKGP
jgi:tRNA A37 threonylcarbamoyladenosine modification protein TsaB